MLARWTGDGGAPTLAGKPDIKHIALNTATLEAQLAHHPALAVAGKGEQIAVAEAQLAKAERRPDWSVELSYQQRGPGYSDMVSLGVSVPLQWDRAHRQDRELAAKLALADRAGAERKEMLRAHVAETRALLNEWRGARERLRRYERELIPLAHQRMDATVAAYRGGKAGLADVLAARRCWAE